MGLWRKLTHVVVLMHVVVHLTYNINRSWMTIFVLSLSNCWLTFCLTMKRCYFSLQLSVGIAGYPFVWMPKPELFQSSACAPAESSTATAPAESSTACAPAESSTACAPAESSTPVHLERAAQPVHLQRAAQPLHLQGAAQPVIITAARPCSVNPPWTPDRPIYGPM